MQSCTNQPAISRPTFVYGWKMVIAQPREISGYRPFIQCFWWFSRQKITNCAFLAYSSGQKMTEKWLKPAFCLSWAITKNVYNNMYITFASWLVAYLVDFTESLSGYVLDVWTVVVNLAPKGSLWFLEFSLCLTPKNRQLMCKTRCDRPAFPLPKIFKNDKILCHSWMIDIEP